MKNKGYLFCLVMLLVRSVTVFSQVSNDKDESAIIHFEDPLTKEICVANWDLNGDGEISMYEASIPTELGKIFVNSQITTFDELKFFTGLASIAYVVRDFRGDPTYYSCFNGCDKLTSLSLPENVKSMNKIPQNVTSITIPGITKLSNMNFYGSNILSIKMCDVNYLAMCFNDCENLKYVVINAGVETWYSNIFGNCKNISYIVVRDPEPPQVVVGGSTSSSFSNDQYYHTTLYVPNEYINRYKNADGWRPFEDIRGYYVKDGITYLPQKDNTAIMLEKETPSEEVTIPSSVTLDGSDYNITAIAANAFENDNTIKKITIPKTVTSIEISAFKWCDNLTDVYCYAENVPVTDERAFVKSNISNAILHVPSKSIEAYRADAIWKNFKSIVALDSDTPETDTPETDFDVVEIKSSGVGTFCSSYDLDFTNVEGLKAYIATGFDDDGQIIWLMRVNKVPAGTGLLVKGTAGATYNVPHTRTHSYYINMLKGNTSSEITINETDGDMKNYYLKDGKFYEVNGTAEIKKNKSYLQVPLKVFARTRSIDFVYDDEDGTTNIKNVNSVLEEQGEWYNLNGQRIEQPRKGLYIKKGNKIVIK